MTRDLMLRRKWTLRTHGEQVVFVKKRNERAARFIGAKGDIQVSHEELNWVRLGE